MDICIHIVVSSNSIRYLEYVVSNYLQLAKKPSKLEFFCYSLDKYTYDYFRRNKKINVIKTKNSRGSFGHAQAMEIAIKNFKKNNINIISDSDVVIVKKNWDEKIVNLILGDKKFGLLGVPYEGLNGFSSGCNIFQTYKNKPTTTWMVCSPFYDFSKLKLLPDKDNFLTIDKELFSSIYGLPIGYKLLKDVGWQIPEYIYTNKIPFLTFEILKSTSKQSIVLKGCSQYHDEFHIDSEPFLVHQRGSMTHRFRIDKKSYDFYKACDQYLNNPSWAVKPQFNDKLRAFIEKFFLRIKKFLKAIKNSMILILKR